MSETERIPIEVATDKSMEIALREEDSLTQRATKDLIAPVIEDSPTLGPIIGAAADAKVAASLTNADILRGGIGDRRVPAAGKRDEFRILSRMRKMIFGADAVSGILNLGNALVRPSLGRFRLQSRNGKLLFDLDVASGRVIIPGLVGGSGGTTTTAARALWSVGQSNAAGNSWLEDPRLQWTHPQLWQYGADNKTLEPGSIPLDALGSPTGTAPIWVVARNLLAQMPPNEVLIIVPSARGGSSLVGENAAGVWRTDYSGSNPQLWNLAKSQWNGMVAAAQAKWGVTPTPDSMYWQQGESDRTANPTDYGTQQDTLFTAARAHVGVADLPIVIGSTNPDRDALYPGTATAITDVQRDTPRRMTRVAFAEGPHNTGGFGGTEIVHYQHQGTHLLGEGMTVGRTRAIANVTTSPPVMPQSIKAHRIGNKVTVEWSYPWCRVTAFVFQTSANGTDWTTVPLTSPLQTEITVTSSAPVYVRVSTTNDVGTSDPTQTTGA